MHSPIIKTKRLHLRKMVLTDFTHLTKIFSDPEAMKYYAATKNAKQTNEWIRWNLDNYAKFGTGLWMVEDAITGEFLGQCGIVPQKVDGVVEMGLGYLFVRQHWGNGYATEAAEACVQYGLRTLQFQRIIALIDIHNTPSIKVAERIGMIRRRTTIQWGKQVYVYTISNPIGAKTNSLERKPLK